MIAPTELTGTETEHPSRGLYFAVLGATARAGRPITPEVRALAEAFTAANVSEDATPETILQILNTLQLCPGSVLPTDDDELDLVIDLGRKADSESNPGTPDAS